eukprot:TRINITY_DN26018_c0_g1_i1.p1 TRINITY_DN26018_c0_g1~~TRINITY_DN26018_c0_g1_i1.p1  ORF type:complete len:550 (+),score=140.33 TRINITY_DN26018_c0_g1_i1:76-1650(+)
MATVVVFRRAALATGAVVTGVYLGHRSGCAHAAEAQGRVQRQQIKDEKAEAAIQELIRLSRLPWAQLRGAAEQELECRIAARGEVALTDRRGSGKLLGAGLLASIAGTVAATKSGCCSTDAMVGIIIVQVLSGCFFLFKDYGDDPVVLRERQQEMLDHIGRQSLGFDRIWSEYGSELAHCLKRGLVTKELLQAKLGQDLDTQKEGWVPRMGNYGSWLVANRLVTTPTVRAVVQRCPWLSDPSHFPQVWVSGPGLVKQGFVDKGDLRRAWLLWVAQAKLGDIQGLSRPSQLISSGVAIAADLERPFQEAVSYGCDIIQVLEANWHWLQAAGVYPPKLLGSRQLQVTLADIWESSREGLRKYERQKAEAQAELDRQLKIASRPVKEALQQRGQELDPVLAEMRELRCGKQRLQPEPSAPPPPGQIPAPPAPSAPPEWLVATQYRCTELERHEAELRHRHDPVLARREAQEREDQVAARAAYSRRLRDATEARDASLRHLRMKWEAVAPDPPAGARAPPGFARTLNR